MTKFKITINLTALLLTCGIIGLGYSVYKAIKEAKEVDNLEAKEAEDDPSYITITVPKEGCKDEHPDPISEEEIFHRKMSFATKDAAVDFITSYNNLLSHYDNMLAVWMVKGIDCDDGDLFFTKSVRIEDIFYDPQEQKWAVIMPKPIEKED